MSSLSRGGQRAAAAPNVGRSTCPQSSWKAARLLNFTLIHRHGGGGGRRETLTALGPSFIKAGQVLASRPDIIREDYMNELCVLQDDVPSFPDVLVQPRDAPATSTIYSLYARLSACVLLTAGFQQHSSAPRAQVSKWKPSCRHSGRCLVAVRSDPAAGAKFISCTRQAFEMMEQDLGRPIAAVFSSISEHPIAAASLGQVSGCAGGAGRKGRRTL